MTHRPIATFAIEKTQFIGSDGAPQGTLPAFAQNKDGMLALMRGLWRVRRFDRRAIQLQRTGTLGTFASSLGQEAVGVGVAAAMADHDVLLPSYRDASAQLWRGASLLELFLFWRGDERGSNFKATSRDFPICITVGSQALHAVGAAYAMRLKGEPGVAVSISGDGSTSKGDFYEALNFAGVWKAPVVFVVNNNQWAISIPREKQTAAETLAQKAIAAGIAGEQVDGNDVVAVREAAARALTRARAGEGPTLIEALSYRLCDHTTSDDAARYRDPADVNAAWHEEPIRRFGIYLSAQGWWNKGAEEALVAAIDKEIETAVAALRDMPSPSPTSMFDHLHAELPSSLREQRAHCAREAAREDANG